MCGGGERWGTHVDESRVDVHIIMADASSFDYLFTNPCNIYKPDAGVDTRWMWTDGRLANGSRVPKCQSSPLPSHFCFVFLFKFELIKLLLLLLCGPGTQINLPLITAITINSQWAWQPANTVSQSINLPKQQQNGLGSRARKQSALFLLRCQMPIDHGAKAY